jgi:multidrug efflux system membrane fusion protein
MPNDIRSTLAAAVAASSILAACSSSQTGGAPADLRRGAAGPVPILSATVEQTPMPVTLPAVGAVEAIASVQIRAQVTGQLRAIHFIEGQDVLKGQPLFSLDPRPFQATLQQAEAVAARDGATWQNAKDQEARLQTLFERGLISRDQFETQRASATALAATVAADKAAIESARLNLQFTEIKAPITGRTGSLGVHVGDLIRANDASAMVVINQMSPVYVAFSVPGHYLPAIRRYQEEGPLGVSAVLPPGAEQSATAAPGQSPSPAPGTGTGRVTFIDNTVDSQAGTIRLKATFTNTGRQLWPGAFVQVVLDLTTDPRAIVVPAIAVQTSQDGPYVYVVRPDRTVEMRPVKVDRQQGDRIVLAGGLSAGETVVTDGHLRLTPGARVVDRDQAPKGGGRAGDSRGGPGGQTTQGAR